MATGICIDNSRRGYNFYCKYFKKEKKNDSSLNHNKTPSGVFYAREIRHAQKELQEIVGAYQNQYQTVTIETNDGPDLDTNDIVNFDNSDWLVISVVENEILRRTEFARNPVKTKQIFMRKGQ